MLGCGDGMEAGFRRWKLVCGRSGIVGEGLVEWMLYK